jgi:hypothetical protein
LGCHHVLYFTGSDTDTEGTEGSVS